MFGLAYTCCSGFGLVVRVCVLGAWGFGSFGLLVWSWLVGGSWVWFVLVGGFGSGLGCFSVWFVGLWGVGAVVAGLVSVCGGLGAGLVWFGSHCQIF